MKIFATKQDNNNQDCLGSFNTKRLDARLSKSRLVCSVQNDFEYDFKKGDIIRIYTCERLGYNEKTMFKVEIQ